MRCIPAAQRETAILNLADENGSDEAVRSDRLDSRGPQETCERRDWQIRDPTRRKRAKKIIRSGAALPRELTINCKVQLFKFVSHVGLLYELHT